MCSRFIPYALTSEQREDRVTSCCDFLQTHENDREFLNKFIIGDEPWCFAKRPGEQTLECDLGRFSVAQGKETSVRKVAHSNHVSSFFQFPKAHP